MLLVFDLEATCWGTFKDTPENDTNEIIEIGAVLLDDELKTIKQISTFVKPVINPNLSNFCKQLTSITQTDVDNAKTFNDAFDDFLNELTDGEKDILKNIDIGSWGKYDYNQLKKDIQLHNSYYPFQSHVNLKKTFSNYHNTKRGYGLKKALKKIDLEFEGNHHRGIDDAINTTNIIKKMFISKKQVLSFSKNCIVNEKRKYEN